MTSYLRLREHAAPPRSRPHAPHHAATSSRAPAVTRIPTRTAPTHLPRSAVLAAIALAGCGGETAYVPRTPHVLALALKRGQPALYRDGVLIEIGDAPAALRGCPSAVRSALDETADHRASLARNNVLAGLSAGLILITPPLFAVSGVFSLLVIHHHEAGNASLIDAINRHNDAPECRP